MNLGQILASQHFAEACKPGISFLSFPTWYEYLNCTGSPPSPELTSLSDVWLIVAAVIEILLRVAALVAVGIIIYAGIQYSTSQGRPEVTSKALSTIISAAIGLAICILSAVIVTFIAGSFK
jgi:ABC-type Fe3+ transport system permease subunit